MPKHHGRTEAYGALEDGVSRTTEEMVAELEQLIGDPLRHRASDLAYAMARFADVDDPALFEGRRKA